MSARSESPDIIETHVVLGKRQREVSTEPVLVKVENVDDNQIERMAEETLTLNSSESFDDDDDLSPVPSDTEDDVENPDNEPEQGEVLWREADEKFPPCAAYHEDVHAICSQLTAILDKTIEHLSEISSQSDSLSRLLEQAVETRRFPDPKVPTIALLGDAGAGMSSSKVNMNAADMHPGKSSLISALLDTPHISREVCTILVSVAVHSADAAIIGQLRDIMHMCHNRI